MKHYGVLFTRNSGKIIKVLEDKNGSALLKMFGIGGNNVTSSRDYVVFNEDGEIVFYCEGKKNDMPTVCKDMEGKNIEELCAGLLASLSQN